MSYTKKVICLANSTKPGGFCFAGKEVLDESYGGWIRPVSARPEEEISKHEQTMADGRRPQLLDVVAIPMLKHRPVGHQQENHLISDGRWEVTGKKTESVMPALLDIVPGDLWVNGSSSSNGMNDRVPIADARRFAESLYLIKPDSLTITVQQGWHSEDIQVRASFDHNEASYNLAVTDPVVRDRYQGRDAERTLPRSWPVSSDAYLCVSLAGGFHGFCYKLVAAVIGGAN